ISGVVVDGYLKDAKVCIDRDNNGACTQDEPYAMSEDNGVFTIEGFKSDIGQYNLIAEIIPGKTVDEDEPNEFFLDANYAGEPIRFATLAHQQNIINPLTTLVHHAIRDENLTLREAEEKVSQNLGIHKDSIYKDYAKEDGNQTVRNIARNIGVNFKNGNPAKDVYINFMSYHKHTHLELKLRETYNQKGFTNPYILKNGTTFFELKDSKITEGQDPDSHLKKGWSYKLENNNFTFSVGWKPSQEVADWFNERVEPWQNTFNHEAGSLNFALQGDLVIDMNRNPDGEVPTLSNGRYYFKDIVVAMAQKHNWYFGGKNCKHRPILSQNEVRCKGEDRYGNEVEIAFLRGNNGDHKVEITPIFLKDKYDTKNWMSKIDDKTKINEITMPGSHDAGIMFDDLDEYKNQCWAEAKPGSLHIHGLTEKVANATQTQEFDIYNQLLAGARYFDIRIKKGFDKPGIDKDSLYTAHMSESKFYSGGCLGESIDEIMEDVKKFLDRYPSEVVFLQISHIDEYNDCPKEVKEQLNREIDAELSEYLYKSGDPDLLFTTAELGILRGKAIVLYDFPAYNDPNKGTYRFIAGDTSDNKCSFAGGSFGTCGGYSNTDKLSALFENQDKKWKMYAQEPGTNKVLSLVDWTLTPQAKFGDISLFKHTLENYSSISHAYLSGFLYDRIKNMDYYRPNIVHLNYINKGSSQEVIRYNFE
ncbi:MAG: hypothetical protein ACOC08_04770, partial [Campylobacterales bacterium]